MASQQENRAKQEKEFVDERYESQKLLRPIKLQNEYNKENLKIQHEFNLEIFKKQKRLTIGIAIFTAFCSFIGIILGILIERLWLNKKPELQSQNTAQQYQDKVSIREVPAHPSKDIKQSAQEESSSKNSLKKP